MKIDNTSVEELGADQLIELQKVRNRRAFNPAQYVELKVALFNRYMDRAGLKAAVVGMSGGIDSAVVMAILKRTTARVVAVSLPSLYNCGVVDQELGHSLSRNLCEKFNTEFHAINVNGAVASINMNVRDALALTHISDWAYGQLTPYVRTPYLYYVTTILKEQGFPAVLVGTTNRDEGAYLGYVGKASDGMVDVQLISDLHKSEVRQVAKYLGVTDEIMDAAPKGDMFDGKTDEQIFGASYDFVELYMTKRVPCQAATNLEKVHSYNAHKYMVGSPAVHLDLYESGVEGGWPLQFESRYWKQHLQFFGPEETENARGEFERLIGEQIRFGHGTGSLWTDFDGIYRMVGLLSPDLSERYFQGDYQFPFVGAEYRYVIERIRHS